MKFTRIACAALALAASAAAQAAPVTVQFAGILDSSDVPGYEAGIEVTGQFSYDTDTLPAADPEFLADGFSLATYAISAPGSLLLNIGGDVLSFSGLNVAILDNDGTGEGGEALSILAEGMTLGGLPGAGAVALTFLTSGANPDTLSLTLPASLELADFDLPFMAASGSYFTDLSANGKTAAFTMTSLTTTAVPEPTTALTMLLGVGLMGGLLSRRRAAA